MNYSTVSSVKHKVEMALIDFKGDDQKCLSCGDVREAIPQVIKVDVKNDGEIAIWLSGSVFRENNWIELYAEQNDDAPVIGAICRPCAIRRKLIPDPEAISVATTPEEMSLPVGPVKETGPNPSF